MKASNPTLKASTPIQAWRKSAGYKTAGEAVEALCKRYRLKPGKDGCPTVATWRAMEQTNGSQCSLYRLDRVARFLGVGCCLRLRTAWPQGFLPKEDALPLRERVGAAHRRRQQQAKPTQKARSKHSGGSAPSLPPPPRSRSENHLRKRTTGNTSCLTRPDRLAPGRATTPTTE